MKKETVRIEPPEPVYTLFDASRDGLPEIVFVNEALLSFEYLSIFPWHLSVEIDYTDFAEQMMPTHAESELLNRICDAIETEIDAGRTDHDAVNALFLARSTWNGIRELAFQVHDPEIAHHALQPLLQSRKWERHWQYEMRQDPSWTDAGYFFKLFPISKGHDS